MKKTEIEERYMSNDELLVQDLIMNRRFMRFCLERHQIKPNELLDLSTKKLVKLLEEWIASPI